MEERQNSDGDSGGGDSGRGDSAGGDSGVGGLGDGSVPARSERRGGRLRGAPSRTGRWIGRWVGRAAVTGVWTPMASVWLLSTLLSGCLATPPKEGSVELSTRVAMFPTEGLLLLSELRKHTGTTQQQLADILGVKQPTLSQLESQTDMQVSTLQRLIEALGGNLELIAHLPEGDLVGKDRQPVLPAQRQDTVFNHGLVSGQFRIDCHLRHARYRAAQQKIQHGGKEHHLGKTAAPKPRA